MKMYLKTILINLALIIVGNLIYIYFDKSSVGSMFLWLFVSIVYCGISSVIITIIAFLLPDKFFSPYRTRFKVFSFENSLYKKMKVKNWKDRVPELGSLSGFSKGSLSQPNNSNYIYKFLTETCKAEFLHFYSALAGIINFFIIPSQYVLSIALPIFLLNFMLHMMPVLIQRFLRPKFLRMYERLQNNKTFEALNISQMN